MTPDLGKYAFTVLASYGATFVLVGGLIVASLIRAAATRRALERQEHARGGPRHGA